MDPERRPRPRWPLAVVADDERLRAYEGVVSVSIGLKEVGSVVTARVCVKVYVERKLVEPRAGSRIPRTAVILVPAGEDAVLRRRVPTDVVEVAAIKLIEGSPAWGRLDPAPIGAEVGVASAESIRGTLGCWVTRPGVDASCFVTAGHVVIPAEGSVPAGRAVYQPHPSDLVPAPEERIGETLEGFVGNDSAAGGYLDYAAVVVPKGGRGARNRSVTPCIPELRPHLLVEEVLAERTSVRKCGASTRCTEGVLSAWHPRFTGGGRSFENILEFVCDAPGRIIADHGDSGSAVVSRSRGSRGALVGLLFAVSHDHLRGYVVPFERLARRGWAISAG